MDPPPETMLITADATSTYTNIQNHSALNQISQYFNGNKTKYRHLLVNSILRALRLIMKKTYFCFGDSHCIQIKSTVMVTPPEPIYATVF